MKSEQEVPISINTWSQPISIPWPAPKPPEIRLGSELLLPAQKPSSPSGFQLVLLDPTEDITQPSAIRANEYVCFFSKDNTHQWVTTYNYTYAQVVTVASISGNPFDNILIVASFGLDAGMAPTNAFLRLLLAAGAGRGVQAWEHYPDIGSQVANPDSWVSRPANYLFVGVPGLPFDNPFGEVYDLAESETPVSSSLQAAIPRSIGAGRVAPSRR